MRWPGGERVVVEFTFLIAAKKRRVMEIAKINGRDISISNGLFELGSPREACLRQAAGRFLNHAGAEFSSVPIRLAAAAKRANPRP